MSAAPPPLPCVAMPHEPLRAVLRWRVLPRPTGTGVVLLVDLVCGHSQWERRSREPVAPLRPRKCVACWIMLVDR